ncbi:MAG TPA: alpha/beta hydrolase [Solirubrobacteraceae bacterium]|nr:alpha/beta hydrolase [Solirubrobacteraceae bacterium]
MLEATLSTGVTLRYAAQGDPAGVPVVLLHGSSDSHRSYAPMLSHLPHDLRAYALTTRGHGDSDKPQHGYALADHVADVAAFLDAVGHDAAVIVGHSFGSYTAQQFAIDHPERTVALVLMGAFRAVVRDPEVEALEAAIAALEDPVDPEFVRAFQESTITQPLAPGVLDQAIAESCKLPARVWRAALDGILAATPPTEAGLITAPTRIVWGDQDAYCPRGEQVLLAAAIPGAELLVYEGTGHAVHWEQPARAAADIAAFLSPRGPRRPRPVAVR